MQNYLLSKTNRGLYRECLRMAKIISIDSGNYYTLRKHVKNQFMANQHLTDEKQIEACRQEAIHGITNYLLHRASDMIAEEKKLGKNSLQRNIFEEARLAQLQSKNKGPNDE